MATCQETPNSRSIGNDGTVTFRYIIDGTSDEAVARALLMSTSPATYETAGLTLYREFNPSLDPEFADTVSDTGHWNGAVRYGNWSATQFSFNLSGGTQHITNSKEVVSAIASLTFAGGTATANITDTGTLIGVSADGVQGMDIDVPAFNFEFRIHKTAAEMAAGYLDVLANLAENPVNDAQCSFTIDGTVKYFNKGDVRCIGIEGAKVTKQGDWEITLKFSAIKTRTYFDVGGITVPSKEGWQYMDVRYAPCVIPGMKVMGQKPVAVYIHKVYEYSDYTQV